MKSPLIVLKQLIALVTVMALCCPVAQAAVAVSTVDYLTKLRKHGIRTGQQVSDVRKTVMAAIAEILEAQAAAVTNKPAGADVDKVAETTPKLTDAQAVKKLQTLYAGQAAGSISLVVLGEKHDSAKDKKRAEAVLTAVGAGTLTPTLVLYERGLLDTRYNAPAGYHGQQVDENSFIPFVGLRDDNPNKIVLGREARSIVVAGYVFLCIAGGAQNATDKVLLVYGAEHAEIMNSFEYFVQHMTAPWLKKRPRTEMLIPSQN
jgi:hypothetical protein